MENDLGSEGIHGPEEGTSQAEDHPVDCQTEGDLESQDREEICHAGGQSLVQLGEGGSSVETAVEEGSWEVDDVVEGWRYDLHFVVLAVENRSINNNLTLAYFKSRTSYESQTCGTLDQKEGNGDLHIVLRFGTGL